MAFYKSQHILFLALASHKPTRRVTYPFVRDVKLVDGTRVCKYCPRWVAVVVNPGSTGLVTTLPVAVPSLYSVRNITFSILFSELYALEAHLMSINATVALIPTSFSFLG